MLVESFSGIRGVYGEDLTEEVAHSYASAFAALVSEWRGSDRPRIVVGMDPRPSSRSLKHAMLSALPCGLDLGIVSTPMCEHAVRFLEADAGIMITASHNEPHFNGFKFLRPDGAVIEPDRAQAVIDAYRNDLRYDGETSAETVDPDRVLREYAGFLRETLGTDRLDAIRDMHATVILDPNGGAGCTYVGLLREFGVRVLAKNAQSGLFAHLVEPNADSLGYLTDIVEKEGASFAAGFDCDADRVELVTEHGVVSGNLVLALVVDEALSGMEPGQTVVVNDATSQLVETVAVGHEATVVESPVGEINVVQAMLSHDAAVGGEGSSSGGIIPPSRCRDGLHSVLFILSLLARKECSLIDAIADLRRFVNIRENLRLDADDVRDARNRFIEHFTHEGADVRVHDSVKAVFPDERWAWMRASRTEPGVLRVIVDAPDDRSARELLDEAVHAVQG